MCYPQEARRENERSCRLQSSFRLSRIAKLNPKTRGHSHVSKNTRRSQMLSSKVNTLLTQVAAETPAGELLRRYWHPFALSSDVSRKKPTHKVKLLAEDLVLILSEAGEYILMGEKCPHRGASLCYAFHGKESIRCPYHGWEFDFDGNCIDKPFETSFVRTKMLPSYPVEERCGILFTYMGPPEERPIFPEWDILNRNDGNYRIEVQDDYDCNWFQIQENAADVTHTFFTHSGYFQALGMSDDSGFNLPMTKYGFQPIPWGILKSWSYEADGATKRGWGNLLIFPNALRLMTEMHWRVPLDDKTTRVFWITFIPNKSKKKQKKVSIEIFKQPKRTDEDGNYLMDTFMSQDAMVTETQGEVFDRSKERLGASDKGIVLFRIMFKEQIDAVLSGQKPIANLYEAEQEGAIIDLREWMGGYIPMSCIPDPSFKQTKDESEIFDDRHAQYELPSRSKDTLSGKLRLSHDNEESPIDIYKSAISRNAI